MKSYPQANSKAMVKKALERLENDSKCPLGNHNLILMRRSTAIKAAYYRAHQQRGYAPHNPQRWYEVVNKILTLERDSR